MGKAAKRNARVKVKGNRRKRKKTEGTD